MPPAKYLKGLLFILGFSYLLILQLKAIWPFTIDDMYISLRYAKHWVDGYGLLWNIGEAPVEGYSNYSFVALAAMAMHWEFDPVLMLKWAGVLGLIGSSVALYLLTRLWFTGFLAFVPSIWSLVYCGQIVWAVSGLETGVYQALISFALFCLLRGMGYGFYPQTRSTVNRHYLFTASVLFALASMTRPEAPALLLLFAALAGFDRIKSTGQGYYNALLLAGLLFAVLYLPYFVWRWYYFGRLLPNSVYCKGFVPVALFELDWHYLKLAWPFLLLTLAAIAFAKDRRHYFFWLPSLVYLVLLMSAEPLVAFFNRLFLPAFVLLLPIAWHGFAGCLARFLPIHTRYYQATLWIGAGLIAVSCIPKMSLANYHYFTLNPQAGELLRQQVVLWLKQHVTVNHQIVLADSGMIPYYLSNWHFIDSYCLNNKSMGASPSRQRYQTGCQDILAHKPAYIILTSLSENNRTVYTPTDSYLHKEINAKGIYRLQGAYQANNLNSAYRYEVYALNE